MIYQSVFGWISTILSICCFVWVFCLLIFVLVKSIVRKVKYKKEQKELGIVNKKEGSFYGKDKRKKKGK